MAEILAPEREAASRSALPTQKLVLVDAYSLLFRAFFAGRALSTTDNRPTGALYGFASMLFALLNNEKPDAIIVCWDAPEATFRSQEYEAYKAHRPPVDSQLIAQMPVARELVRAFGIQPAESPGFEADDLVGAYAERGVASGYSVTILTGDSDQLQLVGDHVTVQMTQRGVSDVRIYDADAVRARYGIGPEQIPDWKALVGDTSDNIPGVPGIGEKTATALLQQWGTLENLLAHTADVTPPKARASLEASSEQARFSRRLATVVRDVPDLEPIRPYAPTAEDWSRVRALFTDLEFKSLLARIPAGDPERAPLLDAEAAGPVKLFTPRLTRLACRSQWEDALRAAHTAGRIGLALDTVGTPAMKAVLRGVAFACSDEEGFYVSVQTDAETASGTGGGLFPEERRGDSTQPFALRPDELAPLLENDSIAKCAHNAKFAEIVLRRAGLRPAPVAWDTLVAAYLLDSGRSSYPLHDLAATHLLRRLEAQDAFAPEENLARDAAAVFALAVPLRAELAAKGMMEVMEHVELPLIPALAAIDAQGLLIDVSYLNALSARMALQCDSLAREIYTLAGEEFNIGSPRQLQTILFDKMQLPTGKKTKSGYSTGADLLEQIAPKYEIARKILEYREVAKLKSTYADALPKLVNTQTGRVHTSLNQTVASTGRLSSSEPNLQNIPVRSQIGREIRRAFIVPEGKVLLSCDYSQIELRLLAHITKDPALVHAFAEDEDVHAATAAAVFHVPLEQVTTDQRRQAKTINFAVIYGQSGFSLASTLGVDTATANRWIREYFERLPGVDRFIKETVALAHDQKYVSTLMGRRRYLPEIESPNRNIRQFAERAAVNMPVQGTAADIMKLAMISVHTYLQSECPWGCTLLLQVHDELLFEVEENRLDEVVPFLVERMESAYPLDVHLRVDARAGVNWADLAPRTRTRVNS